MTIQAPLVIPSNWTVSPLWTGSFRVSWGPWRRPCSSESMIIPWTETWTNTNCHISGMRYCQTHQLSIYSDTPNPPDATWAPSLTLLGYMHILLMYIVLLGMPSSLPSSFLHFLMVPIFLPYFGTKKVGIGEYDIFPQTWKGICRSWFSLEQNCWFIEDKLSSTAVDFIRSEGIAERQHLIWGKASSLSMPRT